MYNADADRGRAARHGGVHAGKMVFNIAVFRIPRRLIVYRGGVVALGFTLHRDPREVRNAHGNAERCLPVALKLVTAEVEVPVGDAVKLAHNALAAVLMRDRCRLLCGGIFAAVGKHIYSGQGKRAQ